MTHTISRYEEKSDALFICISGEKTYLEHFFSEDERATEASRKATIERLVAELQLKDEAYVEPEPFVSKVEEAKAITLSPTKIATAKTKIVADRLAEATVKEVEEPLVEEVLIKG